MAALIEKAGIAGVVPAILAERVSGGFRLFVIALEYCRRADQHFAVPGDAQLDAGENPADGIGVRFAIGLQGSETGELGGTPDLLYVDADRAKEPIGVGAERCAAGVEPAGTAEAQLIAQRRVNQDLAKCQPKPRRRRKLFSLAFEPLRPLGKTLKEVEHPAFEGRRIGRPDAYRAEHALPDSRRREPDRRAELAQVALHALGPLRAVAGKSDQEIEHDRKQRVADPGHRQIA